VRETRRFLIPAARRARARAVAPRSLDAQRGRGDDAHRPFAARLARAGARACACEYRAARESLF
jgi:hypothetical protein